MFLKERNYPRKTIFSDYSVPENPRLEPQENRISKKATNEQLLLKQLSLFMLNIQQALQERQYLIDKMSESSDEIKKVNRLIGSIHESTVKQDKKINSLYNEIAKGGDYFEEIKREVIRRKLSEEDPKLLTALTVYHELLNQGQALKFEAESFRLGTLSNFDPSHTQPVFTTTPEEAEKNVKAYIQEVSKSRQMLIEASVRVNADQEKDRFLLQEEMFDECLLNAQRLYDPKKVQEIHFDMLNVLQSFDFIMEEYSNFIESNSITIRQYEGVHDSESLMTKQIREMEDTIGFWDDSIVALGRRNIDAGQQEKIYRKSLNDERKIEKNLKIYKINDKNFSRYNTETNLNKYYEKRQKFVETLRLFESRHSRWVEEFEVIRSINQNVEKFDSLLRKRQKEINKYNTKTTSYDGDLRRIVSETQVCPIKRGSKLVSFRTRVTNEMRDKLRQSGFKNVESTQSMGEGSQEQYQKIEIYKQFFRDLEGLSFHKKKEYLLENIDKAEKFIFYNDEYIESIEKEDPSMAKEFKKYNFSFKYCVQMHSLLKKITVRNLGHNSIVYDTFMVDYPSRQIQEGVQGIAKISMFRWRELPEGFSEFLMAHCLDYLTLLNFVASPEWSSYKREVSKIEESNRDKMDINANVNEFMYRQYEEFKLNHLQMYQQSILQVSDYSLEALSFENEFWQQSANTFKRLCDQSRVRQIDTRRQSSVDKSTFYSVTFLVYIIKHSSQMKVSNLTKIIEEILSEVEKKLHNKSEKEKYLEIVKITLLLEYLNKSFDLEDRYVEQTVLIKLRRFIIASLLADQYFSNKKNRKEKINQQRKRSSKSGTSQSEDISTLIMVQNYLPSVTLNLKDEAKAYLIKYAEKKFTILRKEVSPLVFSISKQKEQEVNLTLINGFYSFESWFSEWAQNGVEILTRNPQFEFLELISRLFTKICVIEDLMEVSRREWKESQSFLVIGDKNQHYLLKKVLVIRSLSENGNFKDCFNEIKSIFDFKYKPGVMSKSDQEDIVLSLQKLTKKLGKEAVAQIGKTNSSSRLRQ